MEDMKDMKLKGGVLIIGSLLWQDDLDVKAKDGIRKKWRDEYLDEELIKVNLPIRYGRLSGNGIFTMVFSKKCEKEKSYGTGYIKAFKCEAINDWKEIENKAIEMSKAEGMNGRFVGGNKNIWCTMSIIFNSNRIDSQKKNYIVENWKSIVTSDGGGNDLDQYGFGEEETAIKDNCSLNFEWFEPSDENDKTKLDSFDFLICTVTKQKHPGVNNYPSIETLANSVLNDTEREYFKNNVLHGISTFEDESIEKNVEK